MANGNGEPTATEIDLLAMFQLLVNARLKEWEIQAEIEGLRGEDYSNFDEVISDFCTGVNDEDHAVTIGEMREMLGQLVEDE